MVFLSKSQISIEVLSKTSLGFGIQKMQRKYIREVLVHLTILFNYIKAFDQIYLIED